MDWHWSVFEYGSEILLLTMVKVKVKLLSCVQLFVTVWTIAHQAPLSLEFSRQEYLSGLSFPTGIFLTQGSKLVSCIAGRFFTV